MNYTCPLCKSPLSADHYHKVIKIREKEKKVQKGEVEKPRFEPLAIALSAE